MAFEAQQFCSSSIQSRAHSRRRGVLLATIVAIGAVAGLSQLPLLAQQDKKETGAPKLGDLSFMTGGWACDSLEEHWSGADKGAMMGMARLDHGKLYEYMLIEESGDGTVVMRIQHFKPQLVVQEQVVMFRLARSSAKEATFEFLENDFPARIVYQAKSKDELLIRLEDKSGQRKLEFPMKRITSTK